MTICNCMLTTTALLLIGARLISASASAANLTDCLLKAGLETISPSSPNYTNNSLTFNHRFLFKPADIVFPTNASGVAKAVGCASNAGVNVTTRSGGHSYAANGAGGQDGSLVVDLKYLNSVATPNATTAVFGTGIRLGNLALELFNRSERAMAHGTCPYVGSGGHLGCGGFGLPSRRWGLALDAVFNAEVVLANGSIVNANATNNNDLFFAIRGAAPSFGIVTSLTVNTQPAPPMNVVFNYTFSSLTAKNATDTFFAFQKFANSNPPSELGINVRLTNGSFSFYGVYYASQIDAFNKTIKPLLDDVPQGLTNISTIGEYSWTEILTMLSEGVNLNTSTMPDSFNTFYAKSLMVAENELLTNDTLGSFFNYLYDAGNKTDTSWFVLADLWGGNNSAINHINSNATAFSRRSTLYTFQFYASSKNSSPPFPPDGISFVNNMVNSLTGNKSATDFGMFGCYVDPQLSAADAHKVYYGDITTARLKTIKSQYDPNDTFTFPQAF